MYSAVEQTHMGEQGVLSSVTYSDTTEQHERGLCTCAPMSLLQAFT